MLFEITALLTSVALGPVAEVIGMDSSRSATSAVVQADGDAASDFLFQQPLLASGDQAASALATTSPKLQQLSALPVELVPSFLSANPAFVTELLASPPAAREVSAWWRTLGSPARATLLESAPQLVGNLDGVPYAMRNQANRMFLSVSIAELQLTIESNQGRLVVEEARRQLRMLDQVSEALATSRTVPRTLLSLDTAGQGRAAIVIGDLRTADYVSYLIPGMFFTVEGQIVDWTNTAAALYGQQVEWLARLGSADAAGSTVATVAWLGYETPDLTNVGALANAYEGRDQIASAVQGLQDVRAGDQPYITLLAHSYGSTAALMALTEYEFEVDALAMVGSPGSDAQSVAELNVRNGNVFVGEAAWDPVPNSSYFGSDPGSASYGAKPMGVAGGIDVITNRMLAGSAGHIEYFGPQSESLRNMALIGIDKGQFVSNGLNHQHVKASGIRY